MIIDRTVFEQENNVKLVSKNDSVFMKIFGFFSKTFRQDAWTTYRLPFQKLPIIAYPTSVTNPMEYWFILQHELVHCEQLRPWYGPIWMSLLYTLLPLPVLFSGRWFIERRAFLADIKNKRRTPDMATKTLWRYYFYPLPKYFMKRWFTKNS